MRLKIKQKFPCGYEIELEAKSLGTIDTSEIKLGICPIHGEKCGREIK